MRRTDWHAVKHFTPAEFSDPDAMDRAFVMRLDHARGVAGVPMYITSSYRAGDDLSHGRGLAVDVSDNLAGNPVSSRWRIKVVSALLHVGFSRIGIYDRHLHVDADPTLPQNVAWWGESD